MNQRSLFLMLPFCLNSDNLRTGRHVSFAVSDISPLFHEDAQDAQGAHLIN